MKKMLLLSVILLASCSGNSIFRQFDKDFTDNRWQRSDIHIYNFEVAANVQAKVSFDMSYVADVVFPNVPVKVTLRGNGLSMEKIININTSGQNGAPLGDCDGDYCDILFPALENVSLKPGSYTVSVENQFSYSYLPNVIGIGIRIDKSR